MQVPTVTDLDQDPTMAIATGDWVKINADRGLIEVIPKRERKGARQGEKAKHARMRTGRKAE